MARMRPGRIHLKRLAAALTGVAAFAMLGLGLPVALEARAQERRGRVLAAELLVLRGDIMRLDEPGLPAAHRLGLGQRIAGALGLIPWLLVERGDAAAARTLPELRGDDSGPGGLLPFLEALSLRHPLYLDAADLPVSGAALREARAIHEAYCAGCHDGAGTGDPDTLLPARDLFVMGRLEPPEIFLARLYNGVKGDETIAFENPLTDTQLLALWRFYQTPQAR